MSTRVMNAKAELDAAQAEEKAAGRKRDTDQLAEVRRERAQLSQELNTLVAAVKRGDFKLAQWRERLSQVNTAIEASLSHRPVVADLLPTDAEVVEWAKKHDTLLEARDRLQAKRKQIDLPDRMVVIKMHERVEQLNRVEQNLLRKLRGELPGWKVDGLTYVG